MKKSILCGIALVAGLWSCTEDYTDWADPQQNAAKEAAQKLEMMVQPTTQSIDFATYTAPTVQLFTTNLNEQQAKEYNVLFTGDDATKTETLIADAAGHIQTAQLKDVVISLFGKAPTERTLNVTAAAIATNATADGPVKVLRQASPFNLKATLDAPFIDSGYYLTGDFAGWNKDGALAFTHLGSGSVYDDPEFQIMFTATADNQYWKIISATNYNGDFWSEGPTGVVGTVVDGDTSAEGLLTTTKPQAGKIEKGGLYLMTINMMEYTYSIKAVAPQFYMVGALPGWNAEGAATAILYPQSNTVMTYTSKYTGAWDLKLWNKNDLGNWDACYGCKVDGDNSPAGDLINSGAQAISAPSAEFYTMPVDVANMTYSWTKLDNQTPTEYISMGVIGDFNSWGGDMEMKQVTPHNWYVVGTVTDGGLKFRANGGWDVNWGAELTVTDTSFYGKGVANGANISVPAGTYAFYLNDITGDFAIVKQ